MKIVTYNVNGLRPRVAQHGSLLRLLTALDADIICFQETKLSRQDLSVDLTMVEGYEAFFSCNRNSKRGRSGYSGVATFCRVRSAFSSNEVTLPLEAEEGFTGLLEGSRKGGNCYFLEAPVEINGLEITEEELLKVDKEGRCLITDHGHFALFNIYGPRAEEDDQERQYFKLVFYKILQKRWEFLLAQGKRVFVVGDLNIAPAAIDRCDASPEFEKNMFRKWLRSLLRECQGPFFDVFRSKNPREEAYTCFSQRIGAEEFNYGSRIDHILISGSCFHEHHNTEGHNLLVCHVEECDIMSHFRRGNFGNASRWKGGRTVKLEGSDHVPVYAVIRDIPDVPAHNTPSLAVRYFPEVRGWQQSIVSFLNREQVSSSTALFDLSKNEKEVSLEYLASNHSRETTPEQMATKGSEVFSYHSFPETDSEIKAVPTATKDFTTSFTKNSLLTSNTQKTQTMPHCTLKQKKASRPITHSQLTLRSFFSKRSKASHPDESVSPNTISFQNLSERASGDMSYTIEEASNEDLNENDTEYSCEMREESTDTFSQDQGSTEIFPHKSEKDNAAVLEWQRIQQKMKMTLPLCKGHGEPCVARSVKKDGPNRGRLFYVCARAQGPASNPEANCGFFQWGTLKTKEKPRTKIEGHF